MTKRKLKADKSDKPIRKKRIRRQVRLDPENDKILKDLSTQENKSVSDLLNDAVRRTYREHGEDVLGKIFEGIGEIIDTSDKKLIEEIKKGHGDIVSAIEKCHEERDELLKQILVKDVKKV